MILILIAMLMSQAQDVGLKVDSIEINYDIECDSIYTGWHEEQNWEDLSYSMIFDASDSAWFDPIVHFIAGPVDIDCSTGEVVIAEGADISSASIKFWRSLEDAYPYLFEGGRKNQ